MQLCVVASRESASLAGRTQCSLPLSVSGDRCLARSRILLPLSRLCQTSRHGAKCSPGPSNVGNVQSSIIRTVRACWLAPSYKAIANPMVPERSLLRLFPVSLQAVRVEAYYRRSAGPGVLSRAMLELPTSALRKLIILEEDQNYLKYLKVSHTSAATVLCHSKP